MVCFNYLGSFDSLSDLWADYPEGGHEGDYVLVGQSHYGWDKYSRTWVVATISGNTPVEEEQSSDNDSQTPDVDSDEPEGQIAANINYRGEFDNLLLAWEAMPNGGQEGDFIVIDDVQYSWNRHTRQWRVSALSDVSPITAANTMLAAANSTDINYLGTFASLSDVWAFYPEGGSEGEYVVIDDDIYSWDVLGRQWVESDNQTITVEYLQQSTATTTINYLGAFEALADVWEAYPEGGYEGDYIHLGEEGEEVIQVWNKWSRNWGNNGNPPTPAIKGQTFDGTLTINYDLYVQGLIHGTVANATKWANHQFGDYLNQPLRTTDNVVFGKVTAGQFVKSGGTSAQFLKADGSIDENTYLTSHQSLDNYATALSIVPDTSIVLKHGNTVLSTLTKASLQTLIGSGGGGGTVVAWGQASGNSQPLTVAGTTKNLLLASHEESSSHLTNAERTILSLFEYDAANHTLGIKKVDNNAIHFWTYGEVSAGSAGSGGGGGSTLTPVTYSGLSGLTGEELTKVPTAWAAKQLQTRIATLESTTPNVSWGSEGAGYVPLTINGVSKNLLTSHQSLSGYATEAFVNSSIATATATFRGTSAAGLTEAQFLSWANGLTHDANDYVFWNTVDSNGNAQFKRYKYTGSAWAYEYTLNNSSFTAAQWNAINSGITSGLVANIHTHANKSVLDNISSEAVSNWGTAYSHSQTSGNPHATTFAQLQSKPTTLQGYGITDAVQYSDYTDYVAARFRDSNLAQLAVDKYIECWGTPGWWNFAVGSVLANGNVGIGTTSPTEKQHIYRAGGQAATLYQNDNGSFVVGIETAGNGFVWNRSNSYIRFGTNAAERMRITAVGNVGINTTEPTQKLHVIGNILTAGNLFSDNNTRSIGTSGIPWGEIHCNKWYPNPNDTANYIEYTGGGWLVHGNLAVQGEITAIQQQ